MARPQPTRSAPAAVAPESWDEAPALVRVRCVVHSRPFTHERGLSHGEEADVPMDIASAMEALGQVEVVGV